MSLSVPRVLAVIGLLVVGFVLLPLLASFLDGEGTENLIIPLHLVVMAVLGAVVWRMLPGATPATAGDTGAGAAPVSGRREVWTGAAVGLAAAVVALVLFFVLLSGFDGA